MAREMKDSGVAWIGQIPADWSVEKLKFIASFCQEKYREDLGALVYVGLENIVSWNGKLIETESEYDRGQSMQKPKNRQRFNLLKSLLLIPSNHLMKSTKKGIPSTKGDSPK